jgi:hypothetical protein
MGSEKMTTNPCSLSQDGRRAAEIGFSGGNRQQNGVEIHPPGQQILGERQMSVIATNQLRIEEDALGRVQVPAEHLWGAQTQRSLA